MKWETFVEAVACDDAGKLSRFFRYTIVRLTERLDRVDGQVRYENLLTDLAQHVGDLEWEEPHHPPVEWAEFYGDEWVREMAVGWRWVDLTRFGYGDM